jgi:hypothetical protein
MNTIQNSVERTYQSGQHRDLWLTLACTGREGARGTLVAVPPCPVAAPLRAGEAKR